MLTITAIKNPIYAKADNSVIEVTITTTEHGDLPFSAMASDPEPHGQQIFADCVAGKYGVVGPYVPIVITALPIKVQALNALTATDTTIQRIFQGITLGTTTAASADVIAFLNYVKALRAIVSGTDTTSITLPTKPPYPAGT